MDNETMSAQNTCFRLDVWDWAIYCHPWRLVWLQNVLKFCIVTFNHRGRRLRTACFAFLSRFLSRSSAALLWFSFELMDSWSEGANEVEVRGWELMEFCMWSFTTVVDGCDVRLLLSRRTIDGVFAEIRGSCGGIIWWVGLLQGKCLKKDECIKYTFIFKGNYFDSIMKVWYII